MPIKCGKCRQYHATVDDVRACSQGESNVATVVKERPARPMWPASERQVNYVIGLYEERRLPDSHVTYKRADLERMERDEISSEITLLKTYPRKEGTTGNDAVPDVPAGRYAILNTHPIEGDGTDEGDDYVFLKVDRPTEGRWKGYTFVKRLYGSPGHLREDGVKNAAQRNKFLRRIAADPKKAMLEYGLQLGECGACGSPLTNEESRRLGIGPVCRAKRSW